MEHFEKYIVNNHKFDFTVNLSAIDELTDNDVIVYEFMDNEY